MRRVNNLSSNAMESGIRGGHYPSSRVSNSSVALSVSISQITSPTSICKQHITLEGTIRRVAKREKCKEPYTRIFKAYHGRFL